MTTPHTVYGRYDVAIVGGGHNGLVAAAYLARAGLSVVLLERLERLGGATVTAQPFLGRSTRLSRYAELVSLMPERLMAELELDVRLASRQLASYTPYQRDGRPGGLLVENPEGKRTRTSFLELTDSSREYDAWCSFYSEVAAMARSVEPTLMEPLPWERDLAAHVDEATWRDFVATPLGEVIEKRFADDLVRGIVASDALAGTFTTLHDPSLEQNRCFLYRMIGRGTGERRVPIGGMGALTDALARAATRAGAELRLGAGVSAIRAGEDLTEVDFDTAGGPATVEARYVLASVAPWVLHILLGEPDDPETKPAGSQLKVNLLLDRLPRLRSGVDPQVAFAGTMHIASSWPQLQTAYDQAAQGALPATIPSEVCCASLADPSLLGDVPPGSQVLSLLTLLTPAALFEADPQGSRDEAVRRAIAALDEHLVDPIESVVAHDAQGNPCLEVKGPPDLDADLAMPGGQGHHGHLDWPWANNRSRLETPDQQWGVPTGLPRVFLAGAGARRGGAVSGVAGHNAAMAVLASR
ncbi:MAG TPA: NAD(P)/FAD-dependent oxidoreductase [Nocardioides sp.]|uniref:phytoene desaturase family protein n=1 Tax=Nocardioides sp. TaxID=35761 RepID=UPI002E35A103|nr:NAD(P)/FAD-dependent oxidoreductase [Nocardioides sp.]HEX5087236.1 NAD(P)/FAD-dependent oxidoreductase [Nocardioides sp.]